MLEILVSFQNFVAENSALSFVFVVFVFLSNIGFLFLGALGVPIYLFIDDELKRKGLISMAKFYKFEVINNTFLCQLFFSVVSLIDIFCVFKYTNDCVARQSLFFVLSFLISFLLFLFSLILFLVLKSINYLEKA